ncbi:MAG: helix-turn-helix domain-containing protein [Thermoanaerobaculia bacterium]
MKTYGFPDPSTPPRLSPDIRRTRPRAYFEWKTLKRWGRLPPWEDSPAGYLLRDAREQAGLTQAELAARLGKSQQAVAQAERRDSNPTVRFLRRWAEATGGTLALRLKEE